MVGCFTGPRCASDTPRFVSKQLDDGAPIHTIAVLLESGPSEPRLAGGTLEDLLKIQWITAENRPRNSSLGNSKFDGWFLIQVRYLDG